MDFIDKIGAEMEGCFHSTVPNLGSDSSLKFETDREYKIIKRRNLEEGELRSEPESDLSRLKNWIKQYFPRLTNATCGYHIHVSFKKDEYKQALVNREFHDLFLKNLEKWILKKKINPILKKRITEGGYYCSRSFRPNEKYSAVHYLHPQGTVEFRIFSMHIRRKLAQECIDFVKDQIEQFLHSKHPVQIFKIVRKTSKKIKI